MCVITVDKAVGSGRYDRIVRMIEDSEKLKSTAEDHAARLADRLVPLYPGRDGLDVSADAQYYQDAGGADGRFLLRLEAFDAHRRAVCHAGEQPAGYLRQGRALLEAVCPGGYHRL